LSGIVASIRAGNWEKNMPNETIKITDLAEIVKTAVKVRNALSVLETLPDRDRRIQYQIERLEARINQVMNPHDEQKAKAETALELLPRIYEALWQLAREKHTNVVWKKNVLGLATMISNTGLHR
jgi:thioredoxin-like negative regulator of GroEL